MDGAARERAESDLSTGADCFNWNCCPFTASEDRTSGSGTQADRSSSDHHGFSQIIFGTQSTQKCGAFSSRCFISTVRSWLDSLGEQLHQAPSPLFGHGTSNDVQHSPIPAPYDVGFTVGSMSLSERPSFDHPAPVGSNHDFLASNEHPGLSLMTDHIPPLSLDGAFDTGETLSPPKSLRKKKKKLNLVSPSEQQGPRNSFGIDHSFSPPEQHHYTNVLAAKSSAVESTASVQEFWDDCRPTVPSAALAGAPPELLPTTQLPDEASDQDCTVLSAIIPTEPNPLRYLGRGLNFIPQLLVPPLPICNHHAKWQLYTGPPPDLLSAIESGEEVESARRQSITELGEEAYLTTIRYGDCVELGSSGGFLSEDLACTADIASDVKVVAVVTKARDWGLRYLIEKVLQRLWVKDQKKEGLIGSEEVECESDEEEVVVKRSNAPGKIESADPVEPAPRSERRKSSTWSEEMTQLDEEQLDEYCRSLEWMPAEYGDGEPWDELYDSSRPSSPYHVAFDEISWRFSHKEQLDLDEEMDSPQEQRYPDKEVDWSAMTPPRKHDLPTIQEEDEEDTYVASLEGVSAERHTDLHGRTRDLATYPPQIPSPEPEDGYEVCFDEIAKRLIAAERKDSAAEENGSSSVQQPQVADESAVCEKPMESRPSRGRSSSLLTNPPSDEDGSGSSQSTSARRDSTARSDNGSISTTSSERVGRTLGFNLDGKAGTWSPLQAKSTASVGFSGGQSMLGSMSLRGAVSPKAKRSSVLAWPESKKVALGEAHDGAVSQAWEDEELEGVGPRMADIENEKKSILRTTTITVVSEEPQT